MPTNRRFSFSIRSKLLLLLAALLLIPWMGYTYVKEMKSFLLLGQEEALRLSARAISTVLHDRVELFNPDTGVPELIGGPYDLYAYQLSAYPAIDGKSFDWLDHRDLERVYFGLSDWQCMEDYEPLEFQFSHLLGYRGEHLYALFRVRDDELVLRDSKSRNLDNADHIRLTVEDPVGQLRRYVMTTDKPGRMSVYLMDEAWRYPITGEPVDEINAVLAPSRDGYNIEVRVPRYLLAANSGVSFSIADVDDAGRRTIDRSISTASGVSDQSLGRLRVSSPELTRILRGIDRPIARVWILDKDQQVRAVVGRLARPVEEAGKGSDFWDLVSLKTLSDRLTGILLGKPWAEFEDVPSDVSRRPEEIFKTVLAGNAEIQRRPSTDQRAEIIMAAEPIWYADEVIGAVVVEQSTGQILSLQYNAIRNLTLVTLLVLFFVTAALLLFVSRLAYRIRRLRDEADRAVSADGRVVAEMFRADTRTGDEVGDLARSISGMLNRLTQYTRYLERMPDTLAHEMSNPLNVVNSSLENLERETDPDRRSEYMARATNGIRRLGTIVRSLTEAANLEDAIKGDDSEPMDLNELVTSCVEGYRKSFADKEFIVDCSDEPLVINGMPDHLAQLLDKLADNAVNFSQADTPIIVRVARSANTATISVINDGPTLPQDLGDRLFDPMVSVGQKNAKEMHLGLGLYIVRLIAESHNGKVEATSRAAPSGAEVTVTLPIAA